MGMFSCLKAPSSQRGALVSRLSDDLVLHVFLHMCPQMICIVRALNQRFRKIASEDIIWEELLRREIGDANMPQGACDGCELSWRERFVTWRRLDSCSLKVGRGKDESESPQACTLMASSV